MDAKRALDFLSRYERLAPDWAREYLRIHGSRFQKTLEAIPEAPHPGAAAIELGTYGLFPMAMLDIGGYAKSEGTTWENSPAKIYTRTFDFDPEERSFRMFDLNLEKEAVPIEDEHYDFLLCAEVIEHMPTDPMAVFWEMNRLLVVGGKALVTTPNAACASNIHRIFEGNIANSYYYYRTNRSADRHNLEYSPKLLEDTLKAAGFRIDRFWTEQCWNEAEPGILKLLASMGYSTDLRDDNMFALVTKIAPPSERFPKFLYD